MFILEHAGGDWALVETQVMQTLQQQFKPEFLNRVDDIIIFRPLGMEQIERIVDLQLKRLETMLSERKITLVITPDAKHLLAEEGYDPAFGARPLKRSIQRLIQNPLAMAVLEGRFNDGDNIVVRPDGKGALEFDKEPAPEAVGA
jgi:ATP-dependent Clp protease ATP-binding subunit ClpB